MAGANKVRRRTNNPAIAAPLRVLSPLHQAQRQTSLHLDALLADLGVTAQEAQLVAFVAARDGVPVTAVVKVLGVSKSTVTSMLGRLERLGLLERADNPDDARSALLRATRRGAAAGARARERVVAFEHRLMARLATADVAALARIVAAITGETGIDLTKAVPRRRR